MKLAALLLLFTFGSGAALAAAPSATELAESMRQVRLSDGFEARMQVAVIQADRRRLLPFKMSIVGQIGAERQRLRIRGISPDPVRNRHILAERNGGRIHAVQYRPPENNPEKFEPFSKLFDSGLVLWDMFGAWWTWPQQNLAGTESIDGHSCTLVRSLTDDDAAPVREVVSCIDTAARLSLRTQFYGRRHELLRTVTVQQTIRKESGALGAKKMTVAGADRTLTEVEVYGGDEHYLVTPEIFAPLESGK